MRVVQDQKDEGEGDQTPETPRKDDRVERKQTSGRHKQIGGLLEGWVLDTLGRPPGFSHVRAYHLWDDRYRVNVWTESKISDSFFIHAVLDGITYSSPPLEKKYADAATTSDMETGPDAGVIEEATSPDAERPRACRHEPTDEGHASCSR